MRFCTDGYFIYVRTYRHYRPVILALFETPSACELCEILNASTQIDSPPSLGLEFCEVLASGLVRQNPANFPQIVRAGVRGVEGSNLRKIRGRV
jgi:hypothetical protein